MIRNNERRIRGDDLKVYARTLLLVQSTGMGKSRLADKFGETCPMINFTLGQADFKCYPPVDGEVSSFLCKEMSEEIKEMICNSPKRERISSEFISENMAITTWNHTRAAAFLQACFEVCKLHQLSISLLRSVADADMCSSQ